MDIKSITYRPQPYWNANTEKMTGSNPTGITLAELILNGSSNIKTTCHGALLSGNESIQPSTYSATIYPNLLKSQ